MSDKYTHAYHTTPLDNVSSIAHSGLIPNAGGYNFKDKDLRIRSRGRTFFWPIEDKSRTIEGALADEGKREHATLRVKVEPNLHLKTRDWNMKEEPISVPPKEIGDVFRKEAVHNNVPELMPYFAHQWVTRQNIKPEKIEFYDSTLGGEGYQDITAHSSELYHKLEPDPERRSPSFPKPKGQLSLFPRELYAEMVNKIVDGLLNE